MNDFVWQGIDFRNVDNWIEDDMEKNELLKFMEELKSISSKKSNLINPLLVKSDDRDEKNKSNSSTSFAYEELILFEEILAAKINQTSSNQSNHITNYNDTSRLIMKTLNQPHVPKDWRSDVQDIDRADEELNVTNLSKRENDAKPFDAQNLIKRIRNSHGTSDPYENFDLLTCKSQSFLQRLAVFGEMLT